MSPVTICSTPSVWTHLVVLISLFWPFIAGSFLSWRATSAGPIAAVLVPLALSVGAMLMGLLRTLEGMAISGSPPRGAAASAGIAEALTILLIGAFFAGFVIIAAAIRRHRPFVDRLTAALFALLIALTICGLYIAANIANGMWQFYASLTGAGIAAVVALIAVVWTFRTGRGRTTSRPLPYGILVGLLTCGVFSVVIWQSAHHYMQIAMGR